MGIDEKREENLMAGCGGVGQCGDWWSQGLSGGAEAESGPMR